MQKFLKLMHTMSVDIRKQELESQIAQLQCDAKPDVPEGEKIAVLKKQIEDLSKKPLREVALGIDEEYDWEILANSFNNQHTAEEFRSLWKLILHPSINKNPLTKTEHMLFKNLVFAHVFNIQQNWDLIANDLNTGRTGFLCYLIWKTMVRKLRNEMDNIRQTMSKFDNKVKLHLYNKYTALLEFRKAYIYVKMMGRKLTKEHIGRLRQVISKLDNKTKIQLYNKYSCIVELRKAYNQYRTTRQKLTDEHIAFLRQAVSKLDNKTKIQIANKYATFLERGKGRNVSVEDSSHLH